MKVAILTFWTGLDNYGQTLQSYALQYFLRRKGYDAYVVRYQAHLKKDLQWWIRIPFKIVKYVYWFFFQREKFNIYSTSRRQNKIVRMENDIHPRNFEKFKDKYISFSKESYDRYSLFKRPPEADVYIAGSDQIWSWLDPGFYLQFAPKGKKCIAYAPSFGGMKLNDRSRKVLKSYLRRFSVLAMRERDGVDLCKSVGREDAFLVLDPTLLLSSGDYSSISVPVKQTTDYLFLYLLGNDMNFDISSVYDWADKHHLTVKYVASQGKMDNYEKIYPNVDEWLGLILGAKYVVTNSFHGTAFSVIMNKKFLTIPLCGAFSRMNGRVVDLLDKLGLCNRIYSGDIDVLSLPIVYDDINNLLSIERNHISLSFDQWICCE